MVEEAFHPEFFFDGRIGPTLGVHTGPSIIGVGFRQDLA
jgi:fatty acid-binding protein DegV